MKQGAKSLREFPEEENGGLGPNRPSPQPPSLKSKRDGKKPYKQDDQCEQDVEFICDAHPPLLIPEGKYETAFLRAERKWLWGSEKFFLWFQILSQGDFHGEELYMACNAPKKAKRGKVATSNKYYQAWVLAAGRRPDRYDRMSTKEFRGKVFLAKVRTVTKNAKNLPLPPLLQYSVIDDVLERLTDSKKD